MLCAAFDVRIERVLFLAKVGHEAGDEEDGGDLGRLPEAVVGLARVDAGVRAAEGGNLQRALNEKKVKIC